MRSTALRCCFRDGTRIALQPLLPQQETTAMKKMILPAAIAALTLSSVNAFADEDSFEGTAKDAWITGKVETVMLLNTHLNNFSIDTDTEDGKVTLTGAVESDVDRELAGALAKGVDGVISVDNQLVVDSDKAMMAAKERETEYEGNERYEEREGRTFGTWIDDATTTAAVKSKLLGNSETKGLEIDVDTRGDVVTLSGRVQSEQVKQLAQEIAKNTGDVADVTNNLVVDPE
jgi:hyperosmotically inducible protein